MFFLFCWAAIVLALGRILSLCETPKRWCALETSQQSLCERFTEWKMGKGSIWVNFPFKVFSFRGSLVGSSLYMHTVSIKSMSIISSLNVFFCPVLLPALPPVSPHTIHTLPKVIKRPGGKPELWKNIYISIKVEVN